MDMQAKSIDRQGGRGQELLLLLLLLSTGVCTLLGDSAGGQVLRLLWCFCNLFQIPLLFFTLGGWSRRRVETVRQAGWLSAGFVLLYGVQKALIFWAGALRGDQPAFDLLTEGDTPWLFLVLACCLPLGVWLERRRWKGVILACAGAVGCAVGYCTALNGDFLCLSRLFAFFPFFFLGRWADEPIVDRLKRHGWGKALSAVLLISALCLCRMAGEQIFQYRGLFLGNRIYGGWQGVLLRAIQYGIALVLGGAVLALVPRRRLPGLSAVGARWMSAWFWLRPLLVLLTGTALLPAIGAGTGKALLSIAVCCLIVVLAVSRWVAWPVTALLRLPGQLTGARSSPARLRRNDNRLYWRAFFAVFLVLITSFSSYFIANGYSMVWTPDGQNLYLTIMYYTRNYVVKVAKTLLATGQLVLPQWDFSIGQGSSVLSVFHFNPLFLLAVFTPTRWMEAVYGAVTVLQIPLAGMAFTAYCRSIDKREPLPVLVGAVVYAFSGFVIFTAAKHIYFITFMVIYLPLILAGCERWLRKRRWGLFVGMIFLAMVGGYYYAFINTLLMAVYLLIREICLYRTRIRKIVTDLLQLVGLYLWGFALSMVAFLPVVLDFLSSSRSDVTSSAYTMLYPAEHYLKMFLCLVGNDPAATKWVRLGFAGVVFSAGVILFLRWRDRKLAPLRAGALVLFACLCVPLMGKIFNGFGYVTNRWCYGFAFCMALMVVCLLPRLVELRVWEQIALAVITGGYITAVCLLEYTRDGIEWGAMGLLALVTVVIILASHWKNKQVGQGLVAVVTVAAVLLNLFQFYDPSRSNELERYIAAGKVSKSVYASAECVAGNLDDDGFYRSEVEGNRYNRFCLTGGYGTMSYWSVLNADLVNYYLDFDLNTVRQSYAVWGLDERASLCALGSVKYFVDKGIDSDGNERHLQPYGFQAVGEEKEMTIYENQYALPAGYTYTSYQTRSDYEQLSPLERQQAILQGAVVEDADAAVVSGALDREEPELTAQDISWTVSKTNGLELDNHTIRVEKGEGSLTLKFSGLADAETYVYLRGLTLEGEKSDETVIRVSGNTVSKKGQVYRQDSLYYFQRDGLTFNLGCSETGVRSCKITFEAPGTYTFDDLQIICLPMADYVKDVTALGETTLENVTEENGTLSGTIHLEESRLLTLSIPYRESWTVTVDGVPAETLKVNGMYTGVLLEAGDHSIEATYEIPGLRTGGLVSGAALVFTGCMLAGGAVHRLRGPGQKGGKRRKRKQIQEVEES